MAIDPTLRRLVRHRAGNRCEYCRLPQASYDLTFHVEHIIAQQHKQDDSLENLDLARHQCNLHKGTNLATIDQEARNKFGCSILEPTHAKSIFGWKARR